MLDPRLRGNDLIRCSLEDLSRNPRLLLFLRDFLQAGGAIAVDRIAGGQWQVCAVLHAPAVLGGGIARQRALIRRAAGGAAGCGYGVVHRLWPVWFCAIVRRRGEIDAGGWPRYGGRIRFAGRGV